jgi:hypothetical protein
VRKPLWHIVVALAVSCLETEVEDEVGASKQNRNESTDRPTKMVYQQVVDSDVVPGRAPLLPTNETRVALQQEDLQEATPSVTDDDADTDAGRQQPFFATFIKTRGPPQIVVLILLLVIGVFSTVGVVSTWLESEQRERERTCTTERVKPVRKS